ncbi:MAG: hypothetical protein AAGN35_28295 [Bacteroidota bacterium]
MKTVLSPRQSAIFTVLYLLGTLLGRFFLEPALGGAAWVSLALGAFCLVFLWALKRVRFLNFDLMLGGPKRPQKESASA